MRYPAFAVVLLLTGPALAQDQVLTPAWVKSVSPDKMRDPAVSEAARIYEAQKRANAILEEAAVGREQARQAALKMTIGGEPLNSPGTVSMSHMSKGPNLIKTLNDEALR